MAARSRREMERGARPEAPHQAAAEPSARNHAVAARLWVERLTLANFRNYEQAALTAGPEPQVLAGPNGAGKTNILEALSLLAPGQGLRRVPFSELARAGGDGQWIVSARAHSVLGAVDIGTGQTTANTAVERAGRQVRIDGETHGGSGILADYIEMVWVTPAMDGLFTGPASERRRFLDRLILCFDPGFRAFVTRFERAMANRNRLLADGSRDDAQLSGFERVMAETGVALAAARSEAVQALANIIAARQARDPNSAFPWSTLAIEGTLEADLGLRAALDVEDGYVRVLRQSRERDRAAARTLDGPHRSDLIVGHGPKAMPAKFCSTGEQKALLLGLVLAHAELVAERQDGLAPILLLDEITAHLDEHRRAALFDEILHLKAQAWMTGTDVEAFRSLAKTARFWALKDGGLEAVAPP